MYQALYRKYRPVDFNSVIGQDSIVKTLKNSIINKKFSHAYMFFGPRGTGKTTISKIFARNINCSNPIDGNACGKCESCKISFSKDCVDIIEIDAASNNGVDEIRDLKNKISLVPSSLKYKVYIIDEVHMLSIGAFNALLKTLEEPPGHAVFILATTDPQKVPDTIVSRCQCFSFKKISSSDICNCLKDICKNENISIDDDVLYNIALFSDGGLRDALGLLDKLVSYTSNNITMNDFIEINGLVLNSDLSSFVDSIMKCNVAEVLNFISYFDNNGKNLLQILNQLLVYCRNTIVDYYLNNIKLSFSIDNFQNFTNLLNEKMFDIKKSDNPKIYIEMLFLKFMNDNKNTVLTKKDTVDKTMLNSNTVEDPVSLKKSEVEEKKTKNLKNIEYQRVVEDNSQDISYQKILNLDEIMTIRINNTLAMASKELLKQEKKYFDILKDYTFDQEIGFLVCSLLDSKLRVVSKDNIIISFDYESNVQQNLANIIKLTEVYNKITNSNKNIAIISDKEWESIRKDYIEKVKNNYVYEIKEEPKVLFEELNNNDIISSSAMDLFGDIVEID